jgi:hypothetical protein
MAYYYEWVIPKRVIFCYVSGTQTIEEVQRSIAELKRLLDQGEFPTHYIADLRHNDKLPTTNIRQLQELLNFVSHPNLGWTVVIGRNNLMMTYLLSIIAKLTRVRYRAVDTPQEAVAFLLNLDDTLTSDVDLDALITQIQQLESS